MGLFRNNPDARGRSFVCAIDSTRYWQIDRIDGSPDAVADAKTLLTSDDYDGSSVSNRPCDGERFNWTFNSGGGNNTPRDFLTRDERRKTRQAALDKDGNPNYGVDEKT